MTIRDLRDALCMVLKIPPEGGNLWYPFSGPGRPGHGWPEPGLSGPQKYIKKQEPHRVSFLFA